jgi:cytoskeleton protein RodZ
MNDRVHGELLREWRESQKIDVCALALNANLSVAQIKQLESGGASLFYTASIKENAARKVATLLGRDPAAVILPGGDAAIPKLPSVVDELIEFSRPQAQWSRWVPVVLPRPRWIASIVLLWWLLVAIGWFEHNATGQGKPSVGHPSMAMSSVPQTASTSNGKSTDQPVTSAVEQPGDNFSIAALAAEVAAPMAGGGSAAAASPDAQTSQMNSSYCQLGPQQTQKGQTDTVLVPSPARKPGNMVHFVALKQGVVCVVDGAGLQTVFSLKADESRTVYGPAPWRVHFEMPEQAQLFFQGLRLRLPDPSITALLLREGQLTP